MSTAIGMIQLSTLLLNPWVMTVTPPARACGFPMAKQRAAEITSRGIRGVFKAPLDKAAGGYVNQRCPRLRDDRKRTAYREAGKTNSATQTPALFQAKENRSGGASFRPDGSLNSLFGGVTMDILPTKT
jgi:hypothetical protein